MRLTLILAVTSVFLASCGKDPAPQVIQPGVPIGSVQPQVVHPQDPNQTPQIVQQAPQIYQQSPQPVIVQSPQPQHDSTGSLLTGMAIGAMLNNGNRYDEPRRSSTTVINVTSPPVTNVTSPPVKTYTIPAAPSQKVVTMPTVPSSVRAASPPPPPARVVTAPIQKVAPTTAPSARPTVAAPTVRAAPPPPPPAPKK